MEKYLLAAEADKIQDLLFRSSKLREVAGGSLLLTRFCNEMPGALGVPERDIIVNEGGSFRILFDSEEEARAFGEHLAEAYWRITGGTLTVADPVLVKDDFESANQKAHENLRRAKRWPSIKWQGQEHHPYVAFCASCGIGLAFTYTAYHKREEKQYLCLSCWNKSRVGRIQLKEKRSPEELMGEFLAHFYRIVAQKSGNSLANLHWPGEKPNSTIGEIDPVEDIAEYDSRRYVAYLLADGNDMGQLFGACKTPEEMRQLSKGLAKSVREALAEPTALLLQHQDTPSNLDLPFVPIYPLILGGDDLFVLLPAPWALDFARRFALAYERQMQTLVSKIGLEVIPPTISVAVVIAKAKHPYFHVHEIGKALLNEAKLMAKRLRLEGKTPSSTVTFAVILGRKMSGSASDGKVRPTLRPYWAKDENENPHPEWGLPIKLLIEQRSELSKQGVPRKRLAELKDLYESTELPKDLDDESMERWKARLERLLTRIGRKPEHHKAVTTALRTLGDTEAAYWRMVHRYAESSWYGHGLPDLLEAWDFAFDLEKPRS